MLRYGRHSAMVLSALVASSAGCSPSKYAVKTMVPIIDEATAAAWASNDPELIREAVPANLLLLEGMIRTSPRQELLIKAAQFYFSYGFAFVEDEEPERAVGLYKTGRAHGMRALEERRGVVAAIDAGNLQDLERALEKIERDDVPALFWTAASWAGWINLSLESADAIADLPLVEAALRRVLELDESYQYGMPHLLMGAFYAARSPMLGGDPERGRQHFERADGIADGKLLLVPLFEARYYAVQTLDEKLFSERLERVLESPADALPEATLLNAVAQVKARRLLDAREDIF